jgi:hypothetical protein
VSVRDAGKIGLSDPRDNQVLGHFIHVQTGEISLPKARPSAPRAARPAARRSPDQGGAGGRTRPLQGPWAAIGGYPACHTNPDAGVAALTRREAAERTAHRLALEVQVLRAEPPIAVTAERRGSSM